MPDDGTPKVRLTQSLQGNEVRNASTVETGICHGSSEYLLGFDLLDQDGKSFAHAHFNLMEAIGFQEAIMATLGELAQLEGHAVVYPSAIGIPKGTKH